MLGAAANNALLPLLLLLLLCFTNNPTIQPAAAAAAGTVGAHNLRFHEAPQFYNSPGCPPPLPPAAFSDDVCPASALVHVAMTLDADYLRGTVAAVHSILLHAACPESIHFHFIAAVESEPHPPPSSSSTTTNNNNHIASLASSLASAFPSLSFAIHPFNPSSISHLISPALRAALDRPLNYARIRLPDILPPTCSPPRLVYLDSDLILVDNIHNLASTPFPDGAVIAASEHCRANLSAYFTPAFWSDPALAGTFAARPRKPCYFNTGVMVIDLARWREGGYTHRIETWMRLQRRHRIYDLGSLPPFLLEFAGRVATVGQRWNQHGLGGDNKLGLCRRIHPGPVSLLHWSGKGKPWVRIDQRRPCPVDALWAPYDLAVRTTRSTPVAGDEDV